MKAVSMARRTPSTTPAGARTQARRLYEMEVALASGPVTETFVDANPQVLRTILIREDQTLEDLHDAIFRAFDRCDQHMYEFQIGGKEPMDPDARRYVLPMAMDDPFGDCTPAGDVTRSTIGDLELSVDDPFDYWFDFGDDWWHQIIVLAIHDEVPPGRYPKITQKTGDSPPQYVDWDNEDG